MVNHKETAVAHANDASSQSSNEKGLEAQQVEQIHTNERVPGHPEYYEKDGIRTYGDGADHDHEPPVCVSRSYRVMLIQDR